MRRGPYNRRAAIRLANLLENPCQFVHDITGGVLQGVDADTGHWWGSGQGGQEIVEEHATLNSVI